MGEAKRKKEALKVKEAKKPKSTRFNIKNYSKKIQRRYLGLQKSTVGGLSGETMAEHYRNALTAFGKTGGAIRGFESTQMHRAYRTWKAKPFSGPSRNRFMEALEARCTTGAFTNPLNDDTDWVGIEIECMVDVNLLPSHIKDGYGRDHHGLAEFLKQERVQYYEIKQDGSLRNPEVDKEARKWSTVEICIISQATKKMSNVIRLCEALKTLDARVNRRCGLHVHVDMRHVLTNAERYTIGDRFAAALPLLSAMQHPLRQESTFCKLGRNVIESNDRYFAVNMASIVKHKTIELRLHSGTTDANKIIHWCKLLHAIKETDFIGFISNVGDVVQKLPTVTTSTVEYIKARTDLFSGSLEEVSKKNKCTVPFVDEDAEEVRLTDVINTELLNSLLTGAKACQTWEDVANFLREQMEHQDKIFNQIGNKQQLLYGEMLNEIIEKAKTATNYLNNRDENHKSFFINACYKATSFEGLIAIEEILYSSAHRNVAITHPDYIRDSVLNVIRPVLDLRKRELQASPKKPAKVFSFGKLLKEEKPDYSHEPRGIEALVSEEATNFAGLYRGSSLAAPQIGVFTLPDGRSFRILRKSDIAILGIAPVSSVDINFARREISYLDVSLTTRDISDAVCRGFIVDMVRPQRVRYTSRLIPHGNFVPEGVTGYASTVSATFDTPPPIRFTDIFEPIHLTETARASAESF